MTRKIVQRSPNVGIGIRLQPLVPEVKIPEPEPEPPPPPSFFITVSDFEGSPDGGSIAVPHLVTFSVGLPTEERYKFSILDTTTSESEYAIAALTNDDLDNGVTIDGDEFVVPASTFSFTVTVNITFTFLLIVQYQLQVVRSFGTGKVQII